uniref:Neuron navigator 2b n=1 Tax=Cyprinus carpio carpio TaxID=630221 RepID=A0A9J8CW90_CYPCA
MKLQQKKKTVTHALEDQKKIYTDWANHYLAKSGHTRLIKDLQQDVADGVLLAEIIQVVANEKIADINGFPESRSQMIENIDACLGFLAAKGVNIKGLCAEEIRNGNLKAILGLFFTLSRFRQQQQQPLKQASSNVQLLQNKQAHRCSSPALPPHTPPCSSPCPSPIHQHYTSPPCAQKPQTDLLPSPSVRAGGESKPRTSNTNRRSQSFNQCDRVKPSKTTPSPIMVEHGPISSSIPPPSCTSTSKPWRSKSLSAKHTATSSMVMVKQPPPDSLEVPHKVITQKSMLEKFKLFNSKTGSRTSKVVSTEDVSAVEPEEGQICPIHPEAHAGNQRPVTPSSSGSSSPKLALKGIAQLTLGRALAPKIASAKATEKVKEKSKPKEKDKLKQLPVTEPDHLKGDTKTDGHATPETKKSVSKESKAKSAMSGIPKPSQGGKASAANKTVASPPCGAEGERLRNGKIGGLSVHKGQKDNRNYSSTSSLTFPEGKSCQDLTLGAQTHSTASNMVSVQLPQLQEQYNHPNTATVAPFMYRDSLQVITNSYGSSCLQTLVMVMSLVSSGEDSETKRLRTVKNIADLRQNLEETMSSLRGATPFSHSTLETTFDSTITTEINGRALLALSSRPASALPWRLGSSSPRLQAGDAPSPGSAFVQHGSGCGRHTHRHQTCMHNGVLCGLELPEKVEELEGVAMETAGYMSDGDILGKSMKMDAVTSGALFTLLISCPSCREMTVPLSFLFVLSWDDSSSVSSGISDTLDTDDLNTSSSLSSYVNTPSLQTDAEKHSAVNHNPNWSNNDLKRSEGSSDGANKMETTTKWNHRSSDFSDESERSLMGRKTPTNSQTGSWRRGMTAQLGVTSPRTKSTIPTNCSSLKTHGKTDDAKVSEKGRSNGTHSTTVDDTKKPPLSSTSRTPTSTFGFKKAPGAMATITASGAVVTSGSATVGRIPKSVGFSGSRIVSRQTTVDDGYLPPSARTTLQYRSLPRPSRTGTARCSNRSNNSSLDASFCNKGTATLPNPKSRNLVKSPLGTTNQTDREKGIFSDVESQVLKSSTTTQTGCQAGRQAGGKYSEMSSPTLRRLFGSKSCNKQASVTTMENMKNSTIISNPHAMSIQQNGSVNTPSVASGGSGPINSDSLTVPSGGHGEQTLSSMTSSPASAFSPWGGRDGSGSNHISSDSIDVSLGKEDLCLNRTNSAHLVAAFEQSLGNMTIRLQSLTTTAEQKVCVLLLSHVLPMLHFSFPFSPSVSLDSVNGSPQSQRELRIHRQPSSDSVSSMTSATSHSSIGSNLELDAKNKKKKKNWLRSSFKQAFGKKKSPKSASSHSDIEEMTDSSLPSSPKLPYNGSTASSPMIRNSHSNSLISECTDSEAETVMQLRSELRDKEMKLTDIRLEALSSAHQLDQLRESMNRMQIEIERLKVENDRLKMESRGSGSRAPSQMSISPSSVGLSSQHSLTESTSLDMLLEDSGDGSSWKEGQHVKVVVSLEKNPEWKECRPSQFLLGCIGVSGKTKWDVLDGVVRRLFKEYIIYVDPVTQLGLNTDSVMEYSIADIHRASDADTPELLPCGYLVGESDTISVKLKDMSVNSEDSLAFETLIPKPVLQRYISQLEEHRRIIFSGPSGTGKSFLASRLAEYLVLKEGKQLEHQAIATFNVDNKTTKELKQYLSNLADQCKTNVHAVDIPVVLILDNLHHVTSLAEIFNAFLNTYFAQAHNTWVKVDPILYLVSYFRWVLCANHMEPLKGFLGRYLRRKLLENEISSRVRNGELVKIIEWIPCVWHHLNRFLETHSSSDVTIGPRLFLSCPMDVEGSRVWFTDLWNYSIIPYMLEAVREGLQMYGRKAAWEDPAKWVMESFPWVASPQQHEWHSLLRLRPEDVGFDGYNISQEGSPRKQPAQGKSEDDPLMNMLMRLKETAHCGGTESYDSDSTSNSHQDDTLDSSETF